MRVKEGIVEPTKMGRVKSTGEILPTEFRITYIFENNNKEYEFVKTPMGDKHWSVAIAQGRARVEKENSK